MMLPSQKTKKPSLGSRLARLRREHKISRADAAARLGLSPTDIKNLESDRLDLLPYTVDPGDAIRHFALMLGQNPADFRLTQPKSEAGITSPKQLVSLSRTTTSLLMSLLLIGIAGFLIWRIVAALALPTLNLNQPAHGLTTSQPSVLVSGRSSEQAQVFVNNTNVPLNPDGSFSAEVILSPGPNDIEVLAINSFGRQAVQNRTVIYQSP